MCGACLLELFSEDCEFIGAPAGCPHLFHWDCLEQWSQLQNTCPQCKNRFRAAGKYRSRDNELVECVKFKNRNRLQREDESDHVDTPLDLCEKCKEPGCDEDLLLCDGMDFTCNAMFHYRCVGLTSVPSGLWFCEDCIDKGYIPSELKEEPKPKKRRTEPASPPHPPVEIRIIPQTFPRQLLVQPGATRKPSSSLPSNLVIHQGHLLVPTQAPPAPSGPSVFARYRQRRQEKKNALHPPQS